MTNNNTIKLDEYVVEAYFDQHSSTIIGDDGQLMVRHFDESHITVQSFDPLSVYVAEDGYFEAVRAELVEGLYLYSGRNVLVVGPDAVRSFSLDLDKQTLQASEHLYAEEVSFHG